MGLHTYIRHQKLPISKEKAREFMLKKVEELFRKYSEIIGVSKISNE